MGLEFWAPIVERIGETFVRAGTVDPIDIDRIFITDSADEVASIIGGAAVREFGLRRGPRPRRRPWLFE
jgi:hypothetical protein